VWSRSHAEASGASIPRFRLLLLAVVAAALSACGGSAPTGPPAFVFVSTKDQDYALFGADARGKHVRRLTKERGDPSSPKGLFFQVEPAWSPDGTKFVFVSRRDGRFHVYVMNLDGTGVRRLTSSEKDDHNPAWSPDGTKIVFSREGALFVTPAAGGSARRVGRGFGNATDPVWSPDGRLIAYDYRRPGFQNRELYVMNADGTRIRQLTDIGRTSAFPTWSPDGKRVAFQSDVRLGHTEIYTIRPDGTGLVQATRSDTDALDPAWSPSGGLSFVRDGAIWLESGGSETRLTSEKDNAASPAWRPMMQAS
jgi:Tol biopolymer transport system component